MVSRRHEKHALTGGEFSKIIGDAKAFLEAAFFVEQRIKDLNANSNTLSPIDGNKGWPSHAVWESLKTVSHFNLHNALELGLKGFWGSIDRPFSNTHFLKGLYATIPATDAKKLDTLFRETMKDQTIELKAFIRADSPPKRPKSVRLNNLRQFLEYFDKDAALWKKRYAWEEVSKEKWEHYIDDLSVFIGFFNAMEKLSLENWNNRQRANK